MSSERDVQARVMLALGSRPDIRIFRNQVGFRYVGGPPYQRKVRFGLMPGSGDLIGWRTRTITAADVGRTFAQFLPSRSNPTAAPSGKIKPSGPTSSDPRAASPSSYGIPAKPSKPSKKHHSYEPQTPHLEIQLRKTQAPRLVRVPCSRRQVEG